MAQEVHTCRICGEVVRPGDPHIWVKRGRWVFYYHEECAKGGH